MAVRATVAAERATAAIEEPRTANQEGAATTVVADRAMVEAARAQEAEVTTATAATE